MQALSYLFSFLDALGFKVEDIVPQLTMLGLGLVIFHIFSVKPISDNINRTQKCVNDINNASREMQSKLVLLISKTNSIDDWNPLHSLEEKLDWSTMNSPMFLNDDGRELLSKSPMGKFLKDHEKELRRYIENKNPTTAYDVQKYAREYLPQFVLKDEKIVKEIKDFIYNNPIFNNKELEIPAILFVGTLELRDRYLDNHPNLKNTEYDEQEIQNEKHL